MPQELSDFRFGKGGKRVGKTPPIGAITPPTPHKTAEKGEPGGWADRAGEIGLKPPQVALLLVLSKEEYPIPVYRVGKLAGFPDKYDVGEMAWRYIGKKDKYARERWEKQYKMQSLITLGYVEGAPMEIDGENDWCVKITQTGREALKGLEPLPEHIDVKEL